MTHPSTRAERIAEDRARAFVPVYARRAGTAYHARARASYTLGDAIRADGAMCRMCDAAPMALGRDMCAECIAERIARHDARTGR